LRKSHLLILTYEMDEFSPVYSHQIEVVNNLSNHFDKVTVLTGKLGICQVASNVEIYSSNWKSGKRVYSSLALITIFLKLIITKRFSVIFSHMTSTQAALISPISRALRIKHYLWYTHTSKSKALRICHFSTNGILTATLGSCPVSGSKIYVVGHSIDSNLFTKRAELNYPILNFVHAGRLDPIKRIDYVINSISIERQKNPGMTFTQIGMVSSDRYLDYQNYILNSSKDKSWCVFTNSLKRNELPRELREFDAFIHACDAGLDKSLLEATFTGLPVLTINKQYLEIFGSWNLEKKGVNTTLIEEVNGLLSLSKEEIEIELEKRYQIAQRGFEIRGWASRVAEILKS
jgi:glycosyltransferase involved in cell wall biosynthesis